MNQLLPYCLLFGCLLVFAQSNGQSDNPASQDGAISLPSKFLDHIRSKTADMEQSLTRQTEKYLAKERRREEVIRKKLSRIDSNAAKNLFDGSGQRYVDLARKIQQDTGSSHSSISGGYQPYTDSLSGMLKFMSQSSSSQGAQSAASELRALQGKMQDADQVKEYIRQRRQEIGDYISQHAGAAGVLGKQYQGMKGDLYYYSQTVRQYKETLNDPDKLELEALNILNKLPAFQAFMKQHSQLAGLFNLPDNYGSSESLGGLQTRDQVSALINSQVASGGASGQAALQANLESAQSQLDGYKDKLSQLGKGSGDIEMPDFKPNTQKTKTFWRRLEYGTNFQTSRNNYYFPTVSDLGLSVGYKIGDAGTVGIGASYKLGWGNGIHHIAFSSQGLGLRSFLDLKIKGSLLASGGFEYNYNKPFPSMQQLHNWDDWIRSGLLGITKMVSMKSRLFKKTKLQLLWDFLSYQQVPKTQPILFRVGYNLN